MSNNIIDKIQLSGVTYDIGGSGGGSPTVELTQAEYIALVTAGTVSADTYYIITDAQAGDLTQYWTSAETQSAITQAVSGKADSSDVYLKSETSGATEISTALGNKQDTLVSRTNIKTINNESILGSGNITIQGGGTDTGTVQTMIDESISGKVDTTTFTAYTAATDSVLANKQTILTAGTGIDITDNVISATGGGGGGISSAECQTMIDQSISGKADSDNVYTTGQTSGATELASAFAATQPKLSAGTGISIDTNNVISATGGGGVTIDPTLDSGSTNPVANSAITEAVLVPNYRQLTKAEDNVEFPYTTALYVENVTGGSYINQCYYQVYLSGNSQVDEMIMVDSFSGHSFASEPQYVDYEWTEDNSLILTPKASGNYFYKVWYVWNTGFGVYTINDYPSGSSSSVIQNTIYPKLIALDNKTDDTILSASYNYTYVDFGGYWISDLYLNKPKNNRVTAEMHYRYNDFGYDNGVITVKKTSGATSGSTDCITSGGVYDQVGGLKLLKLTQSAYDALSPNYDSNTLYVIVN